MGVDLEDGFKLGGELETEPVDSLRLESGTGGGIGMEMARDLLSTIGANKGGEARFVE